MTWNPITFLRRRQLARALRELHPLRQLLRAERVRDLWANPLSIYSPDPLRVAAVHWNSALDERRSDISRSIEDIKAQLRDYAAGQ